MPRARKTIPWLKIRDGVYYVYWYDAPTNRTKRISLDTKEGSEAQSRYAAFLSDGHALFGSGRHDRRLSVAVALDQYLKEHVATKVVDRTRAEGVVSLLASWFKEAAFSDIDIPACRAYAVARTSGALVSKLRKDGAGKGGKPVSLSTVRRELGILAAAAEHAQRWKRLGATATPPTPMPSIELPLGGEARDVFLTKPQLALAVDSASGRLRDFILVLYFTAARRRSVERLTRFQVDLQAGTINLTSPTESAIERASKKRRPTIPIHAKIRPIIERLYASSKLANNEWLWGDDKDMYTEFNDHMRNLGLPGHPHVLRHSRATHMLQDGVPIYDVARLLGDTIATVDRVYGSRTPVAIAEDA